LTLSFSHSLILSFSHSLILSFSHFLILSSSFLVCFPPPSCGCPCLSFFVVLLQTQKTIDKRNNDKQKTNKKNDTRDKKKDDEEEKKKKEEEEQEALKRKEQLLKKLEDEKRKADAEKKKAGDEKKKAEAEAEKKKAEEEKKKADEKKAQEDKKKAEEEEKKKVKQREKQKAEEVKKQKVEEEKKLDEVYELFLSTKPMKDWSAATSLYFLKSRRKDLLKQLIDHLEKNKDEFEIMANLLGITEEVPASFSLFRIFSAPFVAALFVLLPFSHMCVPSFPLLPPFLHSSFPVPPFLLSSFPPFLLSSSSSFPPFPPLPPLPLFHLSSSLLFQYLEEIGYPKRQTVIILKMISDFNLNGRPLSPSSPTTSTSSSSSSSSSTSCTSPLTVTSPKSEPSSFTDEYFSNLSSLDEEIQKRYKFVRSWSVNAFHTWLLSLPPFMIIDNADVAKMFRLAHIDGFTFIAMAYGKIESALVCSVVRFLLSISDSFFFTSLSSSSCAEAG
jgi:hypothetical protein